MSEYKDIIADAFILCGHTLAQFQPGFRWEPEKVLQQIEIMETLVPCGICGTMCPDGWINHALSHHCDGRIISVDQLRVLRLIKGNECRICNLNYTSEEEKEAHISMHLADGELVNHTTSVVSRGNMGDQSTLHQAVRVKSVLHFNYYPQVYQLWVLIPSWLNGCTLKEKLRNVTKPTEIPITMSILLKNNFTGMKTQHYDIYSTIVYYPLMDENFDGFQQYRRMIGNLWIRMLASINQRIQGMENIVFKLCKGRSMCDVMQYKYLPFVTDEDIREIMQDVLTNHRSIICAQDLLNDDEGCVDIQCTSFVHFEANLKLVTRASEPLTEDPLWMIRNFDIRCGLGRFELVMNPNPERCVEFADELVQKKLSLVNSPVPYFVYFVICSETLSTNETPTLQNIARFTEVPYYCAYVGTSYFRGISPLHFVKSSLPILDAEQENMEMDGEVDNEQIQGGSELNKVMRRGKNNLFMLRNYLEESYTRAGALEAALQFHGALTKSYDIETPVRLINKRIELLALSSLTLREVELILRLVDQRVSLFYDSPDDLANDEAQRNQGPTDWGIFQRPFFFNEIHRLN